jgi:uncharacterized RDD family membrane protein YckC/predicted flap endonuclease-1-like 5' DNA nuclease
MAMRNQGLLGQYAGIVTRGVALIIDILIVIVISLIISAAVMLPANFFLDLNAQTCAAQVNNRGLFSDWTFISTALCAVIQWVPLWASILTGPLYFTFLVTAGGQTVGKYIMGVRVVRLDGQPLTYQNAVMRWVGYIVSVLPLGAGFFWVVFDDRRRSFHDHIAGTCVVYSWHAVQNEYLLDRLHRFFRRRHVDEDRLAVIRALSTPANDLVTLAVPAYADLRTMFRIVQSGQQSGQFQVLGMLRYAKSADGQISRINDAELDIDPVTYQYLVNTTDFSAEHKEMIKAGVPNDHFALAIVALDRDIDALVKVVSQRTSALIRRYDLGQLPVLHPAQETKGDASAVAAAANGETPAMAPRQTPTPVAAPAAPGHDPAAAATPVDVAILLAEVERLRVAQLGLEEKLQARNDELLAIEARIQVADELPDDFSRISGIGKVFAQRLYAAELRTFRSLAEATPEELAAIVKAQKPLQPDFASWNAQARRLAGMDDGQGQR